MRKLLNTLYVTTPEAYLSKDGLNVVISVQQEEVFRIPVINIECIVTFGYMGASPGVMKLCSDNGISLTFLSPQGRFIIRVQGATKGNVLLRKKQYQLSDDASWSLHVVRLMIGGKIQNYRNILRRYIRDYGENEDINRAVQVLERAKRDALKAQDKTELIGYEGMASNAYFEVLPILILNQKTDFPFHGRNRRPPKDAVNAMLSFAYTLIANDVAAALETVGLDPYVGFLHTLRPGRTSLALDMMEELRAYLGDRFILSLINKRQISVKDFLFQGDNGVVMTDKGKKTFITAWQARKREVIIHPYLNEKVEIGLLPYVQAMLMARYIRQDIDDYPVFLIKLFLIMYILVTYDVDTTSKEGARRLRCVTKACLDYGQRVQNSVFECVVTEAQYSLLKGRVRDIIDMSLDSVRFYILSKNENKRVEVIGVETAYKLEEALII